MKKYLVLLLLSVVFSNAGFAASVPVGNPEDAPVLEPLRSGYISQPDARAFCGGNRLPTAKQIALALNPKGVSDTALTGYYRVKPDGEAAFYYNSETYIPPFDESGNHANWIWSSSVTRGAGAPVAFTFSIRYGTFDVAFLDNNNSGSVRCLTVPQVNPPYNEPVVGINDCNPNRSLAIVQEYESQRGSITDDNIASADAALRAVEPSNPKAAVRTKFEYVVKYWMSYVGTCSSKQSPPAKPVNLSSIRYISQAFPCFGPSQTSLISKFVLWESQPGCFDALSASY